MAAQFPSASFNGNQHTSAGVFSTRQCNQQFASASQHSDKDQSKSKNDKDPEYLRTKSKFKAIQWECRAYKTKFTDPDFPPMQSSLGVHNKKVGRYDRNEEFPVPHTISWQRPENISLTGRRDDKGQSDWNLIKDAHPSDIVQGRLGNCWFVAALTLIAEHKNLLSEIFISRKLNQEGIYALRLFKDGRWQGVIIDDYFPCDANNRLVFSRCRRKQLWIMLIEKAMAKLHGSYASLDAGQISEGLNYLTGFVSEKIDLQKEGDKDLLWTRLMSFHTAEFLMGAHIIDRNDSMKTYYKDKMGLVPNHVYSVLKVVCMENKRLIQLRNPWGNFCWKGDWSDESPLWTEYLNAYLSPHRAHEGIFWMCFEDFVKIFTAMEVCKVRKNWIIYTVEGLLPPYADPDLPNCFELVAEKNVEVDISLYKCYKDRARETLQETEIGIMIFQTNGAVPSCRQFKLVKPLEIAETEGYRTLSCNCILDAGKYCIVPYSFGHWTTQKSKEVFYSYALTIHSSKTIQVASVQRSSILAEALICYAKHFGKKHSLLTDTDRMSLTSINFGNGNFGTVVENRTQNKLLELEIECKTTGDYMSTRDSFWVKDKIPPLTCKVVQVLAVRKGGGSHTTTYKTSISRMCRFQEQNWMDNDIGVHQPPITERINGLHQLRPCLDN